MSGYRTQAPDTSIEAEAFLIERYRRMTPAEKIDIVRALTQAANNLALAGARLRFPNDSDDELRRQVATGRLGRDVVAAAFGWPPDQR